MNVIFLIISLRKSWRMFLFIVNYLISALSNLRRFIKMKFWRILILTFMIDDDSRQKGIFEVIFASFSFKLYIVPSFRIASSRRL